MTHATPYSLPCRCTIVSGESETFSGSHPTLDLLWVRTNSNHRYSVSNIEPTSGDAQISTTRSIPESTPSSSGEADVETRDTTAMRAVRTNLKGVN